LLRPRSQNPKAPTGVAQITDNGAAAVTIAGASQLYAADNDWWIRSERTPTFRTDARLARLGDGDQRGRMIADSAFQDESGWDKRGRSNRSPLIARNKARSLGYLSGIIRAVQCGEDRPQLHQYMKCGLAFCWSSRWRVDVTRDEKRRKTGLPWAGRRPEANPTPAPAPTSNGA
jgi:hypothetical protein